ncbi:uncharacterized protein LOC125383563 [Haliotis rufescens]|uniref:uncharacterized protein LOC125383563 n=1 Tax=Haliotis rufescens TaxID=6454 RepID=UPI00201E9CFB|nr:uncharacterized protein LOC125383563 [Haliotis rufescens]
MTITEVVQCSVMSVLCFSGYALTQELNVTNVTGTTESLSDNTTEVARNISSICTLPSPFPIEGGIFFTLGVSFFLPLALFAAMALFMWTLYKCDVSIPCMTRHERRGGISEQEMEPLNTIHPPSSIEDGSGQVA